MIVRLLLAFACSSALPLATADDGPALLARPKCTVTFDKGLPKVTLHPEGAGWTVAAAGNYKIDPGYQFKLLQVHTTYRDRKTGKVRNGPTLEIPDESVIRKGRWAAEFHLAAPTAEQDLRVRVLLRVVAENDITGDEYVLLSSSVIPSK